MVKEIKAVIFNLDGQAGSYLTAREEIMHGQGCEHRHWEGNRLTTQMVSMTKRTSFCSDDWLTFIRRSMVTATVFISIISDARFEARGVALTARPVRSIHSLQTTQGTLLFFTIGRIGHIVAYLVTRVIITVPKRETTPTNASADVPLPPLYNDGPQSEIEDL